MVSEVVLAANWFLEDREHPRDRGNSQCGVGLERVRSGFRADPKWFGAGLERDQSQNGVGLERVRRGSKVLWSGSGVG